MTRKRRTRVQLGYDAQMPPQRPLIILGSGYTGRYLYRVAGQQSLPIQASSRRPDIHLTYVEPQARLRFDLADPASWSIAAAGRRPDLDFSSDPPGARAGLWTALLQAASKAGGPGQHVGL